MNEFQTLYDADLSAYPPGKISRWGLFFHYFLRKTQCSKNRLLKNWYHLRFRMISRKHRLEISHGAEIGKGFCLLDPFTVTINSNSVLGTDVRLGKNVTIGKQNRGKYAGSPVIGNRVIVGDNAVIVGKIRIGDDVQIAANSYVNRDIPSNSKAAGNPAAVFPEKNPDMERKGDTDEQ